MISILCTLGDACGVLLLAALAVIVVDVYRIRRRSGGAR